MANRNYFLNFGLPIFVILGLLGVVTEFRHDSALRRLPKLQASNQRDFIGIPYLHIVSVDPTPVRILDVTVNKSYHLYGFCNVVFVDELNRLGIHHYGVDLGAVYPRYSPGDPSYTDKISSLNGCAYSGVDSLQMGESMDIKNEDLGSINNGTFEAMKAWPVLLEVKTNRGVVALKLNGE